MTKKVEEAKEVEEVPLSDEEIAAVAELKEVYAGFSKRSRRAAIDKMILKLYVDEPFYAGVMLGIRRTADTSVKTAGVRFNSRTGRFEMVYNPDFLCGMKTNEALAIIKHEVLHVLLKHVTDRKAPMEEHGLQIWNHATDLAINSSLRDELPRFTITPEGEVKHWEFIIPGEGMYKNYPSGQYAEWYLNKILNDDNIKKKFVGQRGSGEGEGEGGSGDGDGMPETVDDHGGWSDGSGAPGDKEGKAQGSSALERAELRRLMEEGKKRALGQNWGTVPQAIQKYVLDYLEPTVNWKGILRYFIQGSQRADKYSSYKKYNRRYPYQHPGRRVHRTAKIAIAIDQSGSVSDKLLAKFFTELQSLAQLATFDVVPFDTMVHEDKIFTWKKGNKKQAERVACGGTNFDAPTTYVNENPTYDALIILTDMCAPKPGPCRVARLWITDASYKEYIEPVAGLEKALVIPE